MHSLHAATLSLSLSASHSVSLLLPVIRLLFPTPFVQLLHHRTPLLSFSVFSSDGVTPLSHSTAPTPKALLPLCFTRPVRLKLHRIATVTQSNGRSTLSSPIARCTPLSSSNSSWVTIDSRLKGSPPSRGRDMKPQTFLLNSLKTNNKTSFAKN